MLIESPCSEDIVLHFSGPALSTRFASPAGLVQPPAVPMSPAGGTMRRFPLPAGPAFATHSRCTSAATVATVSGRNIDQQLPRCQNPGTGWRDDRQRSAIPAVATITTVASPAAVTTAPAIRRPSMTAECRLPG